MCEGVEDSHLSLSSTQPAALKGVFAAACSGLNVQKWEGCREFVRRKNRRWQPRQELTRIATGGWAWKWSLWARLSTRAAAAVVGNTGSNWRPASGLPPDWHSRTT